MTPTNKVQQRGLLKKAVLLLSTSYMGIVFAAGDLPSDYVGNQSFNLGDDPRLTRLRRDTRAAKNDLAKAEQKLSTIKTRLDKVTVEINKLKDENTRHRSQITNADTNKAKFQKIINDLNTQIASLKSQVKAAQTNITKFTNQKNKLAASKTAKQTALKNKRNECRATPTPECKTQMQKLRQEIQAIARRIKAVDGKLAQVNKDKKQKQAQVIAKQKTKKQTQAKLANLPNTIKKLRQKIQANRATIQTKDAQVSQMKPQLRAARKATKNARVDLDAKKNQRQDYRERLVRRIMEVNKLGAQEGRQDGRFDGNRLAQRLGNHEGERDGELDGDEDGTDDGRTRDYNKGKDRGIIDGEDRAQVEGKANGTDDGTHQGNVDAAIVDGKSSGKSKAQNSDASQVGTAQGNKAGLQRAIQTGKSNGTQTGEDQAIQQSEAKSLDQKQIAGPFAGSFSKQVPRFPQGHQGRSFDDSSNARRELVRRAFADGYNFRYDNASERSFERNIDSIYNNAYDSFYDSAYRTSFNDFYQADYNEGETDGKKQGYDANYPRVYRNYYDQLRAQFSMNPNTQSNEYKSTFSDVESDTYKAVYSSIKSQFFNKFEKISFDANIADQTEKFRAARFASVAKVYKNSAVLKFNSSSMVDAGNNGVAANDGVFMPNESVSLNVKVTNYGEVAANNVVINTGAGQIKLPSLPALSTVLVKGAAKASMDVAEGQRKNVSFTLSSPLTMEAKIQGKFFENQNNGVLTSRASHQATAQYPLNLTSLNLSKTLLLGQPNQLKLSVFSQANRSLQGPIKIELQDDSRSNVIAKGFADIQSIGNSATFADATVLVNDEDEAYTEISINAKIYKNNVLLGYLKSPLQVMAKAPYKVNASDIIVVGNSDLSADKLLDVLAQTGGITNSAVLDLSLPNLNSSAINNGFQNKTLLVLDEGQGRVFKQLDAVLANSSQLSLIAIDDQDIEARLRQAQSFQGADAFDIKLHGQNAQKILITNPFIAGNHAESYTVARAELNNFAQMAKIFKHTQKSNDEHLASAKALVNANDFYAPTVALMHQLQFFNLRMLQEVLVVNQAYRHFDESSKYKDMIKHDGDMFHNKLKNMVGSVNSSNVGLALVAYDAYITLKKATKHYKPIERKMKSKIKGKLWGAFFKSGAMKNYPKIPSKVRKHDKGLSKKMVKYENIYSAVDLTDVDLPNRR